MSIEKRLANLEKRLRANSEEDQPIRLLLVGYEGDPPLTEAEKEEAMRRYYEKHPEDRGYYTFFILGRNENGVVEVKSARDLANESTPTLCD
jgi:hypothetical protein